MTGQSLAVRAPKAPRHLDGRTFGAKRRRELTAEYVAALGGEDRVTPLQLVDAHRAAELTALAETLRTEALRNGPGAVDLVSLTRLEGSADRAVRRLGIKPGATGPKPPTLAEYLAANYPASDDQEADDVATEAVEAT
jgi:hypothetical protein